MLQPSDAFWASFWPALWSGAIYSVICGVVVGIVMLRFQKGVESRSVARTHERELSLKRDHLRRALGHSDVININSAQDSVPVAAAAALKVLEDCPLTCWKESLPNHARIINSALDFQRRCAEFESAARLVDKFLEQRIRAWNHARNAIAANDSAYRQFAVGRLLGIPEERLLPWLSVGSNRPLQAYEDAWQPLREDAEMQSLGKHFQQARLDIMKAVTVLRQSVDDK